MNHFYRKMYLLHLIPCLCIALSWTTQTLQAQEKRTAISISLIDEHAGVFSSPNIDTPMHLGGTIALERYKDRAGIFRFSNIYQAGYYYHKEFNQVAFIGWKPKFEWRIKELVGIHTTVGIAYAHSFRTQRRYVFENGIYTQKTNFGKPHLMPSLGLGLSVDFNQVINQPIELFARGEVFSLAPYAPNGYFDFTINSLFNIGVKYTLNNK